MHHTMEEKSRDEIAVAASNALFYCALEDGDYPSMASVWLHSELVKCVHPGWELLIGWAEISRSWQNIFSGTHRMRVRASDVLIQVEGDFGLVSCQEHLAIFINRQSAPLSAVTNATNLFQRVGETWRMIHHHASAVTNLRVLDESDPANP